MQQAADMIETDFGKKVCLACGAPLYGPLYAHAIRMLPCGCLEGAHGESVKEMALFHFVGLMEIDPSTN